MFGIIVFLSILGLDQITKEIISSCFIPGETIPVIKGFFHLTLVHNPGIAFGMFKNQTTLFVVLSLITTGIIAYNIITRKKKKQIPMWEQLALFAILAGAVGNLADRLRFGYVIDFLDFRIWPVFNIADSAITIGVIIILLKCIRLSVK